MILNEPEASLHPDLLDPLARLLTKASQRCQIIVVSHSSRLVTELEKHPESQSIELHKEMGETVVPLWSRPEWKWPSR
jgi:predicted ATPase